MIFNRKSRKYNMITVEKFNEKSWEGDNRWRRVELEKISEELNIEIIGSNKDIFDRINERLVLLERSTKSTNPQIKKRIISP